MLQYFYTLEYDETPDRRLASALEIHARMYTAGKKFAMIGLTRVGASRFDAYCRRLASDTTNPDEAFGILADAVGPVYRHTAGVDDPLRTSLVQAVRAHFARDWSMLDHGDIKDECIKQPEFAYDIMKRDSVMDVRARPGACFSM